MAKRLIEGFTQRKLPDRSAWLMSTIAHWAHGSAAGAAYGILAGSLPTPHPTYGVPFGVAVFANDYISLPVAGLYQPIWEYRAPVVAWDLGAHLAYGAGTGFTFWLLVRVTGRVQGTVRYAAARDARAGLRALGPLPEGRRQRRTGSSLPIPA